MADATMTVGADATGTADEKLISEPKSPPTVDEYHAYVIEVQDVLIRSYSILNFMADAVQAIEKNRDDTPTHQDSGWGARYILSDVAEKLEALCKADIRDASKLEG
jgi:hypothetical protein